jgi:hypothetical protein
MRVEIHDAPAPFEAAARGFLECNQAHNTLLLSMLARPSGAPAGTWWSAIASRKAVRRMRGAARPGCGPAVAGAEDAAKAGRLLSAELAGVVVGPEPMATSRRTRPAGANHAVMPLMQLTTAARMPAAAPPERCALEDSDFDLLLD